MEAAGHSSLLKYFRKTPTMSEHKTEPTTIESTVPGVQKLRAVNDTEKLENIDNGTTTSGDVAGTNTENFVYSPVITVTKEESTLTKGEMKLQKVVVTEDVSDDSKTTNVTTVSVTKAQSANGLQTDTRSEVMSVTIKDHNTDGNNDKKETQDSDQKESKKATKIPKLKFKQAVERIKKEKEIVCDEKGPEISVGQKVRSSIPRLKDFKVSQQENHKDLIQTKNDQEKTSPLLDDEFDKIYEEIIENEVSNNIPTPEKLSNPIKLESKFEEIIHDYDENKVQPITTDKVKSKIPLLKRKSEQEIEIPPPSNRRNSLKKSNADDSKGKIPVAITKEKTFKTDIGSAKHETSSETKTFDTTTSEIQSEQILKKNFQTIGSTNIVVVKRITAQKSNEQVEFVKISSNISDNLVQFGKVDSTNVEELSKLKQTDVINLKATNEPEKYREVPNKHSVRENVTEITTDEQFTPCKSEDSKKIILTKVKETDSMLNELSDIKSSSDLLHNKKLVNSDANNVDGMASSEIKVTLENVSQLSQQTYKKTYLTKQTSLIETNLNVKEKTAAERKFHSLMSIPNISSKVTNATRHEIISSKHPSGQSDGKVFDENLNFLKAERRAGVLDRLVARQNSISNEYVNENKKSSNVLTNVISDSNATIVANEKCFYEKNDERQRKKDLLLDESKETTSNEGEKGNKNNEKAQDRVSINVNTKTIHNHVSQRINHDLNVTQRKHEKNQSTKLFDDVTLEYSTSTIENEPDKNIKSVQIELENNTSSNNKHADVNNKKQPQNNCEWFEINDIKDIGIEQETTHDNQGQNMAVQNINIEDTEEEDITILKGKVSRVIKRLDSKEYRTVKKEMEDVPKEVSIVSKIAIFERSKCTDMETKINLDTVPTNWSNVIDDKPKIVNEILKSSNKIDTEQNLVESTPTVQPENLVSKEIIKLTTKYDVEIKKVNNNETKISNVSDNEVFMKKDDEMSSLEIWKEYRRKKELDSDIRRAKSLAELDLGDAVRGKVRQMVVRMNSVDRMCSTKREIIDVKEKPRMGSVSQRIALYERKLTSRRGEDHTPRTPPRLTPTSTIPLLDEEELTRRIEELSSVRETYREQWDVAYVELADGTRMPALALGTAMLDPRLVKPLVSAAIALGFRSFDTAPVYGNERELGAALRDEIRDGTVTRSELFITSKLWSTCHGREAALPACRRSLDAMGLDYFDLYLVHNPMSFKEGPDPLPRIAGVLQYSAHDYLDAWFGLERVVGAGLARSIGVSNFNSQQLERVVEKGKVKPVINQVECHPYLSQLRLEEFCLSRHVKLSCYGVLGSRGTPAAWSSGQAPVIDDPLVKVMAAGLGVTPAQLLIRYQTQQGRAVVVSCSRAAHLRECARAAAPLEHAHLAALSALNRNRRTYTFSGLGDTHRNYPFRIPF